MIKSPSPLDAVLKPTIGPNKASAMTPVKRLSLKDFMILDLSIKPSRYLVSLETLWEKILAL